MNAPRFDHFARHLGRITPRRRLLVGLALSPLAGLVAARPAVEVAAKKKHKRKKKTNTPKPNAFGCLDVGDPCKSEEQCCSGLCEGKKGKRTCRAHDNGTCNQTIPAFCDPDNPTISLCNSASCVCVRTTAGSNFCTSTQGVQCADCTKDADCEALGFLPGSACLPWSEGQCAGDCGETGMACAVPCGAEITGPIT